MPLPIEVWMAGTPGRSPFAGHVRGVREVGEVRLAWAGRIAGACPPAEAWNAAEDVRDALADLTLAGERSTTLVRVDTALRALPASLLGRADLSLLVAVADPGGILLAGFGLDAVLVESTGEWLSAALGGSSLLGEPGLPATLPGESPLRSGARFLAVPVGVGTIEMSAAARLCGVRA